MTIYADTSFLVSVYVADPHSAAADALLRSKPRIYVTDLHFAEWTHAIGQNVFRGQLSSIDAARVTGEFEADRRSGLWSSVAMPDHSLELCAELARRHAAKLGVRTLDSLHVACALELRAARFWTFDERQAKLAQAEGLKTA